MCAMKLDWKFLARNLARQLASIDDVGAVERIVDDAERDARSLSAPDDFWVQVAEEYRSAEKHLVPGGKTALDELHRRQPDRPIFANDPRRRVPR